MAVAQGDKVALGEALELPEVEGERDPAPEREGEAVVEGERVPRWGDAEGERLALGDLEEEPHVVGVREIRGDREGEPEVEGERDDEGEREEVRDPEGDTLPEREVVLVIDTLGVKEEDKEMEDVFVTLGEADEDRQVLLDLDTMGDAVELALAFLADPDTLGERVGDTLPLALLDSLGDPVGDRVEEVQPLPDTEAFLDRVALGDWDRDALWLLNLLPVESIEKELEAEGLADKEESLLGKLEGEGSELRVAQ